MSFTKKKHEESLGFHMSLEKKWATFVEKQSKEKMEFINDLTKEKTQFLINQNLDINDYFIEEKENMAEFKLRQLEMRKVLENSGHLHSSSASPNVKDSLSKSPNVTVNQSSPKEKKVATVAPRCRSNTIVESNASNDNESPANKTIKERHSSDTKGKVERQEAVDEEIFRLSCPPRLSGY